MTTSSASPSARPVDAAPTNRHWVIRNSDETATTGRGVDLDHRETVSRGAPLGWVRTKHQSRARSGSPRRTSAVALTVALSLLIALLLLLVPSAHALVVNPASPVTVGQQVSFSESNGAFCCTWSFGDGRTGSGRSTTHAYATPGTYTVRASGFYLNPITKGPGASFTTTATVIARNPLDPSPPEASVQLGGAVAQPSVATASTAGDSGRITGVGDDASLSWSARGGDPQSGVKDVKLHVTTTSVCRDVIAQRTTSALFTDTHVGAPTAGTTSYTHTVDRTVALNNILGAAGARCASPSTFDYAIIRARAEITNGVDAKTFTQSVEVRYEPRLRVIAYNLGGGTDKNDNQESQHNYELEGLKQRVGDADIALLQEVRKTWCEYPPLCTHGPQFSLVDQGQLIADATALKYFVWRPLRTSNTGTRAWTAGPAIFSRYPLRNPRYISNGGGGDAAVVAEATINGVPHLIISVHYPHCCTNPGPARQQEAGNTIAKMAREFRGPVIIGGDFNNGPGNPQLDTFLKDPLAVPAAPFADARWNGQTTPFFKTNSFDSGDGCLDEGIDHIFWRGSTQGTPDYPSYASVAQHRNYRHLTYEARCSLRPNSNHPLILARLR